MDRKLITRKKEGERKAGHARIARSCGRGMLALLLCICLLGMNIPVPAFADETPSGGGIAAPTFTADLTDGNLTITLSGAEGANIYYAVSTDDSRNNPDLSRMPAAPTSGSALYADPIPVTDQTYITYIKAVAVSGENTSDVMTLMCGYTGRETDTDTDVYGTNIGWTLDCTSGSMVLRGSGQMCATGVPWASSKIKKYIRQLQIENGIVRVPNSAFCTSSNLQSVTLPESVTSIGVEAFAGCALSEITLPSQLESIGDSAFYGDKNLSSLYIPASVTDLGDAIAYGDSALTSLVVDAENENYYSESNCIIRRSDKELLMGCKDSTIPKDITGVCDNAFRNMGISTVELPDTLVSIGKYAFANAACSTIVIPDSVTRIDEKAFFKCENLTKIVIPDSVTTINGAVTSSSDTGIFKSCSDSLEIYCVAGSGVETQLKSAGYTSKLHPAYEVQLANTYTGYSLQKAAGTTTLTPFPNDPVSFTITANEGYKRNVTVKVNGEPLTPVNGVYTINAVNADTYKVTLEGTGLCAHENAVFTADAALHQISASCPDCGADDLGTFTLTAQDGVYDGAAKPAAVSSSSSSLSAPAIAYTLIGAGGAETALTGAPTAAGTYRASITCGSATVSTTYEITRKPLTASAVTLTPRAYDGTRTIGISGVTLDGIVVGDDVSVDTTGLTGTLSGSDVGVYNTVTIGQTMTLTGDDAANYTLTQPTSAVTVDKTGVTEHITKAAGLSLSASCRYASGAAVTFDPKGYLPADCGTVSIASVSGETGFFNGADCVSVSADAKTVSLTLQPIVNGASTGSFALHIDTANYKTSVLTVNVTLTEQAAPEITAVSVGTPKDTSATVTAAADAGAATYYLYYTTALWQSANIDDLTASGEGHLSNAGGTFVLSGLTPATHYYVYIAAADAAGNVGNIRVADFTTAETQQSGGNTGGSTGGSSGGSSGGGGSFGGGGAAVPDTPATPDADTDKEPQIKGENGAAGWDAIRSEFASAKDGDTITVQMNGARTVPGKTLKSIRGKDVSVTFELTERLSLTINGADLRGITIKNKNNYSVLFLWTVTGVTHLMQSVGA